MINTANGEMKSLMRTPAIIKKMDPRTGRKKEPLLRYRKQISRSAGADPFSNWTMPEQAQGYIQPKKNDFL